MGLLEGSGRGGKGADGTQKEVHQRHVECQKVEAEREGIRESRWDFNKGGKTEGARRTDMQGGGVEGAERKWQSRGWRGERER